MCVCQILCEALFRVELVLILVDRSSRPDFSEYLFNCISVEFFQVNGRKEQKLSTLQFVKSFLSGGEE